MPEQAEDKIRTGYRVIDGQYLIYDANLLDDISPELFDIHYWREQGAVLGEAPGRGTTFFLQHPRGEWALRHYKRGGGMGMVFNDGYFWSRLTTTRPWQEWHLLMDLYNLGLPVCPPVAARVHRRGMVYRADLITRRIGNARTWQDWMFASPLPGDYWVALGKFLRRFHNTGLYHHDLNIRNILRTEEGKLYLIDFDRARMRKPGGWQRANLARLKRSIHKLEGKGKQMHFSEDCWGQLLQGYASAA